MDSLDGAGDRAPRESGGEGASGAPSVLALSALALLLAALPYIAGFLAARRGEVFLGALNNLGDTGQYLAALRQGMGGQLLYVNQYTSVRVAPALIYPLYTAFGFLCAPLHVSPLAVYTLLRAIAAVALLAALRGLCRAVCPTRAVLPFALALFGGGLYVPVLLLSPLVRLPFAPVALTAPEFSLFAMLLNSPHGTLGLAAELWGLTGYLRWRRERDPRGGAMLAAGGLALGLCYPFGLAVLLPVVGVDSVLAFFGERRRPTPGADAIRGERRRRPSGADVMLPALALLPAFGLALYYAALFRYDPHWGASGMLRLPPPSVPVLAAAFGPLVALALPIVWRQARPRSPGGTSGLRLMTVWAIVTPLLLLLPVPQSERLLSGWSVALALLGAASLGRLGARRARRARRYVLLLSLSNVMLALLYLAVALGGGGATARTTRPPARRRPCGGWRGTPGRTTSSWRRRGAGTSSSPRRPAGSSWGRTSRRSILVRRSATWRAFTTRRLVGVSAPRSCAVSASPWRWPDPTSAPSAALSRTAAATAATARSLVTARGPYVSSRSRGRKW